MKQNLTDRVGSPNWKNVNIEVAHPTIHSGVLFQHVSVGWKPVINPNSLTHLTSVYFSMCFTFMNKVYQFRVLPLGLSTASQVFAWAILWWITVSVAVLPYLGYWLVHHPDWKSFCFATNAQTGGLQNNCLQARTWSSLRHSVSQGPTSSGSGESCSSRFQGSKDSSTRLQSILPSLHVFLQVSTFMWSLSWASGRWVFCTWDLYNDISTVWVRSTGLLHCTDPTNQSLSYYYAVKEPLLPHYC